MMQRLQTIGGLKCRVLQDFPESEVPELLAVLCHGFGAPGSDLVMLAEETVRMRTGLSGRVQFIFPEAPLALDHVGMPGGRAWWMIDINRLVQAAEHGEFRNLRSEHPDGLPEARALLMALIQEAGGRAGLPLSKVVLGGFSQGAMLTTDVALRLPERAGGLVVWSGTLLSEDEWTPLAEKRGPLRVFQSHGLFDPILPYVAAEWLRNLFIEAGFEIDFHHFKGMHQIPPEAVLGLAAMLDSLLDGEAKA